MPFPLVPAGLDEQTRIICNDQMLEADKGFEVIAKELIRQYVNFWPKNITVEEMQARINFYENTPSDVVIGGVTLSCLDAYFYKANGLVTYIYSVRPDLFPDAYYDVSGDYLPDYPTYKYQKYFTAGWKYNITQIDGKDHMVVTEPCDFSPPE